MKEDRERLDLRKRTKEFALRIIRMAIFSAIIKSTRKR